MRVAVIGAGKMGLPLACQFASRGASVTACDANPRIVEAIRAGVMPFEEPGVEQLLREARDAGRLDATTDLSEATRNRDVVVVIVPVLVAADRRADLSIVDEITRGLSRTVSPGMLISYETTIPVGTTRNHLRPLLEASGLRAGEDFDLAFSPERVKSRLVLKHLTEVPKIVGGATPASACRAAQFYERYLGAPVINLETLEAAEFAKLAGMIYRDVNIALANELAAYAEAAGVDFGSTRAAANTDGESFLLSPGIGVGGHCTPVYPHFILRHAEALGIQVPLTAAARALNEAQPERLFARLEAAGFAFPRKRVLILGLGFRPRVKEHAFSPAFSIRDAAAARGAEAVLHDPLYSAEEIRALGFQPAVLDSRPLADAVVLNTFHPEYSAIDFQDWRARGVQAVIDGRNAWSAHLVRAARLLYVAPGAAPPSR